MAPKAPPDASLMFLWTCLQNSDFTTVNYAAVGAATNTNVPAVRMRWTRLKKWIENGQNSEGNAEDGESEPATPKKKKEPAAKKQKTTAPKRATKRKKVSEPEDDDEDVDEEVENAEAVVKSEDADEKKIAVKAEDVDEKKAGVKVEDDTDE